jgi:hypothetical protein
MRWLALVALIAACSSSAPDHPGSASSGSGEGNPSVSDAQPADKTSWTYIYAAYFGPNSLGHCGNAGCHQTARQGFACGTTKDSCYNGLVAKNLIGTSASTQPLVDLRVTPLSWFKDGSGFMPADNPEPNDKAAEEIASWVTAGAQND